LLRLALALLGHATVPGEESVRSLSHRSSHFRALSRAYGLRGDRASTIAALRQAITAADKLYERLRVEKYTEKDLIDQKAHITELVELLGRYSKD
jgi:hypothetical protein